GKTIQIDGTSERLLAQESGVQIRQTKDGYVKYEASGAAVNNGQLNYHTFSTNKGYSCQLLLPDGTNVWLNTASSIQYPAVFSGNERHITLTGEAYFEVAHDISRPFNVDANGSLIQVLGTHFNVSA